MDTGKSFSFPFADRDWTSKLGLGAVISFVPILNFAWSGYLIDILRNVMNEVSPALPGWEDMGKKFNDGLVLFGASLIYALPILIGLCLPLSISAFSSVLYANSDLQDLSQRILEAGGVLFFCYLGLLILYGLVLSVLYPAILVLFAREGTFASCFRLREALELISRNTGAFFTAWGLSWVVSIGVSLLIGFVNLVVGWVPCIGWIISMALSLISGAYLTAVYAHLFGQFGKAAFEQNS